MDFSPVFVILFLIYIISAISSRNAKMKKNAAKRTPERKPVPVREAVVTAPAAAAVPHQPEPEAAERLQPTVHVSEHHHENMYAGSLDSDLNEGNAPSLTSMPSASSHELFKEKPSPDPEPEKNPFDFSPNPVVNAVIVSEVLKRPALCRR